MTEIQTHVQEWVEPEPWHEVFSPRKQSVKDPGSSITEVPSEVPVDETYLAALESRHPMVKAVARWFRTDHLPHEALHGDVAREFQQFVLRLLDTMEEDSDELTVCLRKLLEAKDAAVRAALS